MLQNLQGMNATNVTPNSKKRKAPGSPAEKPEKRMRRFRAAPPSSFPVWERACAQRFFVLTRTRHGLPDCPEESVELTGSTGNIYTVTIGRQPTCTCPHALAGNQCKHVLFVLSRVLRAKWEYVYQLALLSTELQEIFTNAPPIDADSPSETSCAGKRKPIEGDCPICYTEFDETDKESIVWCRAACGQNIHAQCFQRWAATKCPGQEERATCPMCRSQWERDPDAAKRLLRGDATSDGYVNVADQLGISTARDTSTYHNWGWRSRQSNRGYGGGYYGKRKRGRDS